MGDSVYLAAGSDLASFELCLSILLDVDMSFIRKGVTLRCSLKVSASPSGHLSLALATKREWK